MPLSPSELSQRARLGAHSLHAQGKTNTEPARKAFLERFEREVDPDGKLEPAERARRAEHARKAYFTRLALKSAQARRKAGAA
ncbi:MAG TPA: hypothetical protein VMM14_00995 [Acidimicrobiia bacterium]|nr:hypothetical protein [Acidimicrobiia bacterium]